MRTVRTFLTPVYRVVTERWKIRFTSRRLKLDGHELDGDCDHDGKSIRIRTDMEPEKTLDTIIHEFLHATYPFLNEEAVKEPATAMASLLRRLGYIRVSEIIHD